MDSKGTTFEQTVRRFIEQEHLLCKDALYIVGLSGGADSVALLFLLKTMGYRIEAAHCNFLLRGEESNRDEAFAALLCKQQDIPFHRIHFDTLTYAKLHHLSIEMAARELRYQYFEQLRNDIGAKGICVAHHRDDNIETLLMNLIRGTGIHGLTGIRPIQGNIIRPLLCVSRRQIEEWLQEQRQAYVTDSTNLVANVVRNKIRLQLLPMLRQINPSTDDNLLATIKRMTEAERIYNDSIEHKLSQTRSSNMLKLSELQNFPSPEVLLFEWLRQYGFSPATISQIYDRLPNCETGRLWSSPTHEVLMDRGKLIVQPKSDPFKPMTIPEPGCYVSGSSQRFAFSLSPLTSFPPTLTSPSHACLDAAKVKFPLTIRQAGKGDRFTPFGMMGSRLVSDFLTDQKVSLFERRRQLVLTDATNAIVWLVDRRPSQHHCIDATTVTMLDCCHDQHSESE